ncbi:hypothetical protein [Pantoea ananatis]|nr:hypothetical protein [Pantoea ananatis]
MDDKKLINYERLSFNIFLSLNLLICIVIFATIVFLNMANTRQTHVISM